MAFRELTISALCFRYSHGAPRGGCSFSEGAGRGCCRMTIFLLILVLSFSFANKKFGCSRFVSPRRPLHFPFANSGMQSFFSPPSFPAFSVRKLRGCSFFFPPACLFRPRSLAASMAFRELTISATLPGYFLGVPRIDHFGHTPRVLPWRSAN